MTNINTDQIAAHFSNYADCDSLEDGFVSWCWDDREETLEALLNGSTDSLASDVAYSAEEGEKMQADYEGTQCTEAAAEEFIQHYKTELIEAITESLND